MVPDLELLTEEIEEISYPNRTYHVNIYANRVDGYTDDVEAVKQAVYFILNTERYEYPIYSWDYGIELLDLFGKPIPYVMAELPRRITEALEMDDRISSVENFEFTKNRNKIQVTFTVITAIGELDAELEVEV